MSAAPKTIVITGSTRGIGLGMAQAFTAAGHQVVASGRSQHQADEVAAGLNARAPGCAAGIACDVGSSEQVRTLWDFAVQKFGRVDIWINNAGISNQQSPVHELPPDQVRAVYETNVIGTLNGIHVAVQGMLQQGDGLVCIMEGLGSDGRKVRGLGVYGSTKYAISYLAEVLFEELRRTPVKACTIQPGMVLTDMLVGPDKQHRPDWDTNRRIFNILADRVDVVAPWIVRQLLRDPQHGARIRRMSALKAGWRFLSHPFTRRDVVSIVLAETAQKQPPL